MAHMLHDVRYQNEDELLALLCAARASVCALREGGYIRHSRNDVEAHVLLKEATYLISL